MSARKLWNYAESVYGLEGVWLGLRPNGAVEIRKFGVLKEVLRGTMKQKMLDGSYAPVGPHRDDIVVCSDGTELRREEAYKDCMGDCHSSDYDRRESNCDIVRDVIDGIDTWVTEYAENEDYAEPYDILVLEDPIRWKPYVDEWVCDYLDEDVDLIDKIVEKVWSKIYDYALWEVEHNPNEYACYCGDGCYIDSFEIGEVEEQVDVNSYPELLALHKTGDLEACLAAYNGDAHISHRSYYDGETGKRVNTGFVECGKYPHFYTYHLPGGRWSFYVSKETMIDCIDEAFEELNDEQG